MAGAVEKSFADKLRSRDPGLMATIHKLLTLISTPDSEDPLSPCSRLAGFYAIVLRDLGALDSEFLPTIAKVQAACQLLSKASSARECLVALKKWLVKSKQWLETARDPWIKLYALKTHVYGLYFRALVLRQSDKEVGVLLKTLPSQTQISVSPDPEEEVSLMSKPAIYASLASVLEMTEIRSAVKVELDTEGYWWGGKFYDVPPYGVSSIKNTEHQHIRLSILQELVYLVSVVDSLGPSEGNSLLPCDPDLDGGIADPFTRLPFHILHRQGVQLHTDCDIRTVGGQLRPRRCMVFTRPRFPTEDKTIDGPGIGAMIALALKFTSQLSTVRLGRELVLIEGLVDAVIEHSRRLDNPILWLDLADNSLLNPHVLRISQLSRVPYIDLSGNKINDDAFSYIDQLLVQNATKFLSIANNNFTERSIHPLARKLESLQYGAHLRCLDFSGNQVADPIRVMEVFADSLHARTVHHVPASVDEEDEDSGAESEDSDVSASVRKYTNKLALRWRAERRVMEEIPSDTFVTHAVSVKSLVVHVDESLKDAKTDLRAAQGVASKVSQSAPRVLRLEKVKEKLKSHPFVQIFDEEDKLAKLELVAAKAAADAGAAKGWGLLKKASQGSSGGAGSSAASISNIVSLLSKKSS